MRRSEWRRGLVLFLVAGCLSAGSAARANLLVNGSFEQPDASATLSGIITVDTTNTPPIPGWTVTGGSVDVIRQSNDFNGFRFFPAYDLNQTLDLDGNQPGTIEQVVATMIGVAYQLTFAYANNPDFSALNAMANVSVIGAGTDLSANISHTGSTHGTVATMNYSLFSGTFVASSATTTIRFTSLDPAGTSGGIILDAVALNESLVPEPGTLALSGLGILGVVGYGWRRRRLS
jgi:hypothetical protein